MNENIWQLWRQDENGQQQGRELPRPQGGALTAIKCTAKPLACLTGKIE
jgi:hypothetical protein